MIGIGQSAGLKTPTLSKVAIKILNKSKIIRQQTGLKNLLNEIQVHWALEQCVNILRLL